ncbi:MAG: hypothetical protein NVSMB21_19690 [Vulcanimicrobiaceae bacterium]
MDSLILCRCTHSVVAHSGDGCAASRCACRLSKELILERELSEARREHLEMYRQYAEPDRRESV